MTHGQHLTPPPPRETARDASDPVPFFSQADTFVTVWPLVRRRLAAALDTDGRGWGAVATEFEQALAAWADVPRVVAVRSRGDALALLLRAAGVGRGDAVVVPAVAPVSTAAAVVATGADVVFADVGPRRRTLTGETLAAAVTSRTTAILLVHPGHAVAWDDVLPVCAARGLAVVEDLGGVLRPGWPTLPDGVRHVGAAVSLGPTAVLGAVGDAGAVFTDDPEVAEAVRRLRWLGMTEATADDWPGLSAPVTAAGTDARLGDVQAAVLLAKLARLDEALECRAALAARYTERLSGLPQVSALPPVAALARYRIEVDRRDGLAAHLAERGIDARPGPATPLPHLDAFPRRGRHRGAFPHAAQLCARALALPFHADLSETAVDRVCAEVASYLSRPRPASTIPPTAPAPSDAPAAHLADTASAPDPTPATPVSGDSTGAYGTRPDRTPETPSPDAHPAVPDPTGSPTTAPPLPASGPHPEEPRPEDRPSPPDERHPTPAGAERSSTSPPTSADTPEPAGPDRPRVASAAAEFVGPDDTEHHRTAQPPPVGPTADGDHPDRPGPGDGGVPVPTESPTPDGEQTPPSARASDAALTAPAQRSAGGAAGPAWTPLTGSRA